MDKVQVFIALELMDIVLCTKVLSSKVPCAKVLCAKVHIALSNIHQEVLCRSVVINHLVKNLYSIYTVYVYKMQFAAVT